MQLMLVTWKRGIHNADTYHTTFSPSIGILTASLLKSRYGWEILTTEYKG
jgi:hypothetical protein